MMRHALVLNTETRRRLYAPYDGMRSDKKAEQGKTLTEQVANWCHEQGEPGPLMIIESGGGKAMRFPLY